MEEQTDYVRRTQGSYSLSLKLQIVGAIERGELSTKSAQRQYGIQGNATVINWLRKYGNFDWENKTPEQKIIELEAKVKLLEKQKAFLEHQANVADKKVIIFDMMIDLAEKEYKIGIRKNSHPEQSKHLDNKKRRP